MGQHQPCGHGDLAEWYCIALLKLSQRQVPLSRFEPWDLRIEAWPSLVEGSSLENCRTLKSSVSSNLTASEDIPFLYDILYQYIEQSEYVKKGMMDECTKSGVCKTPGRNPRIG